jgi:uncharacterized phiE125 gp8 family phage protein
VEVATPILVSSAGQEPVTLAEAKLWLREDEGFDDALINSLITAAREWFEVALDRILKTATWVLKLGGFYSPIELPYPPLQSVVSVAYLDGDGVSQTLGTGVYDVVTSTVPAQIQLADGQDWPATDTHPEAVTITFRTGYDGDVPEMVKCGIKMLVAYWYGYRGDEEKLPPPPPAIDAIVISSRSFRF